MTIDQMGSFIATLVAQVGLDSDKADKSLDFWKPNLLLVDYAKSIEGIKVLLLNDTVKVKDPGKWISQIVRYCGGAEPKKKEVKESKQSGCDECCDSGYVEVPSAKDWNGFRWNGQYTMVVACECGMGQMAACRVMNIRQFTQQFPNWRLEYPVRQWEWRLAMIESRPVPADAESKAKRIGLVQELKQLLTQGGQHSESTA